MFHLCTKNNECFLNTPHQWSRTRLMPLVHSICHKATFWREIYLYIASCFYITEKVWYNYAWPLKVLSSFPNLYYFLLWTQIFREIKCVSGFFLYSQNTFLSYYLYLRKNVTGVKTERGCIFDLFKAKNGPVYRQKEKGNGDGKVDYETQTVGSCRVFLQTGTLIHLKLHWALMMS